MKFLVIHPDFLKEAVLLQGLRAEGAAIFVNSTPEEAEGLKLFHHLNFDLIFILWDGKNGSVLGDKALTWVQNQRVLFPNGVLNVVVHCRDVSPEKMVEAQQQNPFILGYFSGDFNAAQFLATSNLVLKTNYTGEAPKQLFDGSVLAESPAALVSAPPKPVASDNSGGIELGEFDFDLEGAFELAQDLPKIADPESEILSPAEAGLPIEASVTITDDTKNLDEATGVGVPAQLSEEIPSFQSVDLSAMAEVPLEEPEQEAQIPELPSLPPFAGDEIGALTQHALESFSSGLETRTDLPAFTSMEIPLKMPPIPEVFEVQDEVSEAPLETMPSKTSPPLLNFEDAFLEKDLPHISETGIRTAPALNARSLGISSASIAMGEVLIPGQALQEADIETLKKHMLLREQDVIQLASQLRSSKDRISELEADNDGLKQKVHESASEYSVSDQKIAEIERDYQAKENSWRGRIEDLERQIRDRNEKVHESGSRLKEADRHIEEIKEQLREDLRKIRVRERELENRLEIMRMDRESLVAARNQIITELKRKVDHLEYTNALLREQNQKEKATIRQMREKLEKAARAMRMAGGLLDTDDPFSALGNKERDAG